MPEALTRPPEAGENEQTQRENFLDNFIEPRLEELEAAALASAGMGHVALEGARPFGENLAVRIPTIVAEVPEPGGGVTHEHFNSGKQYDSGDFQTELVNPPGATRTDKRWDKDD